MSFKVKIKASGNSFNAEINESILEAALKHNIVLPYGCKNGSCGACKGKVVDGIVDYGQYQPSALGDHEKKVGMALFCQATPKSDLLIEAREVMGASDIEVRRLPSRVQSLEKVADDVVVLKLKLPSSETLQFLPGQYVDILLRDGKRRSYSMANSPIQNEYVELHVRNMENGTFTKQVFESMKVKDILRFEGPLGTFFFREDSEKPIIFVASGTGFAPIKSILEYAFEKGVERPMTLYWGGRRPKDIYMKNLVDQWTSDYRNFKFVPVISDQLKEDAWTGRDGLVHHAVMADYPDLSSHQIYACGVPVMVESAQRDFVANCNLPAEEFYSDAFTPPVDPKI